jgi:hypothetical protein
MANKGFNLKVREVENGFTIHVTRVSGEDGKEKHFDFIAESTEIKTKLGTICDDEVDELRGDRLPEKFR